MLQIALGVIGGFFAWVILWVASEKGLSAIWPEGFGAHQRAFEAAITNGSQFTADTRLLVIHIVIATIAHSVSSDESRVYSSTA